MGQVDLFSSVTQLCLTLCNPMDCSMPGLHVHHQLPEFMLRPTSGPGRPRAPLLSASLILATDAGSDGALPDRGVD